MQENQPQKQIPPELKAYQIVLDIAADLAKSIRPFNENPTVGEREVVLTDASEIVALSDALALEKFNALANLTNLYRTLCELVEQGVSLEEARQRTNFYERVAQFIQQQAKWYSLADPQTVAVLTNLGVGQGE